MTEQIINPNDSPFKAIDAVRKYISQHIVGQQRLISRLLIALLADGHLLVEGAPGLAKTKVVRLLGDAIEGDFHRIQFTPDLLPADVTGTDIFRPNDGSFSFQKGPIFHNLLLADEINRAPAKVQSALLEAMGERQVTIGLKTYQLPQLFLVMATQNNLEHEGTYPLPEAQLDRFQLYVQIDYPNAQEEQDILRLNREELAAASTASTTIAANPPQLSQQQLFAARKEVSAIHLAPNLEEYLIEIVMATREPKRYDDDLARWLANGASPRGTIALDRTAKAKAWLAGRDFVTPADIQDLTVDTLNHRLVRTFAAVAEGVTSTQILESILNKVAVP